MSAASPVIAAFAVAGLLGLPAIAQAPSRFDSADEARAALDAARQQQRNARARGERLEREAASSRETSRRRPAADAAALAARVQQAEASVLLLPKRGLPLANRKRRLLDRRTVGAAGSAPSLWPGRSNRCRAARWRYPRSIRFIARPRLYACRARQHDTCSSQSHRGTAKRSRQSQIAPGRSARAVADRRDSEAALLQRRKQLTALAEQANA